MTYASVNHDVMGVGVRLHPMSEEETMAQRISRQMEVKNLNQSELARLMKVARMTVNQWVNGVSEPTPDNLVMLAEILCDGDVHYLVHGSRRAPEGGFPPVPKDPTGSFATPFRRRRKT